MKVFISWSKPTSRQLALILRDWLPEVIQQVDPWMSSEDIDKGQRWAAEIGAKLGELGQGILCVTAENLREPWLNFEAGALAKSLDDARVRPVLLDLQPSEVTGPLAQFQATVVTDPDDMLKLVTSLNEACAPSLEASRLKRAFDRNWDDFAKRVAGITPIPPEQKAESRRTVEDVLGEVLERVRELQRADGPSRSSRVPKVYYAVTEPEPESIDWPRDAGGDVLKPGEAVTFSGGGGVIHDMKLDESGHWLVVVRNHADRSLRVVEAERLTWSPF